MKDDGQYRFIFNPNLEKDEYKGPITSSLDSAMNGLMLIANYTLHLHEQKLMEDYTNYGGIQKFETDGCVWVDLDEDELT